MPPHWITFVPEKSNGDVTLGDLQDFVRRAVDAGVPLTQSIATEPEKLNKPLKWVGVVDPLKKS
ncbi:hypothetical protein ACFU5O_30975 [Streptomyces sp. NPDC057445]|uniref:hypothetical protein n=1 Tax=Streptomyces sp. NPDC057445 TaxID=3346136 RepID=UPI00369393C1